MNRHKQDLHEFLDRSFARFRKLPAEDVESACERVLDRFRENSAGVAESVGVKSLPTDWRMPRFAFAVLAVLIVLLVPFVRPLLSPKDVFAIVETVNGSVDRVANGESHAVSAGEKIGSGKILRTNGGAGLVFDLSDGARVEMRSNSELSLGTADDGALLQLNDGSIIVTVANQPNGRPYVQTRDMTVSVNKAVFLVNAEDAGSRVAVIQGDVSVQQGAKSRRLLPGEQLATNPSLEAKPVAEEISWSSSALAHMALLRQSASASVAISSKPLEFEAATLRRVYPGEIPTDIKCRGIDGVWSSESRSTGADAEATPLGRCIGIYSLSNMVKAAYDIPARRISGLPSQEVLTMDQLEFYQLEAKVEDPRTVTREQLRQLVRNLIIDRFKLKAHTETKEEQGYFLRAVDSGVKFKETAEDEERVFGSGLRLKPACYWCLKAKTSMKTFVDTLGSFIVRDRPVADGTGLKGVYDITLMLTRIEPIRDGGDGARSTGGNGVPLEFNPSLAKALEDQLGLRLERGKVPVEYLVVEHVERPGDN